MTARDANGSRSGVRCPAAIREHVARTADRLRPPVRATTSFQACSGSWRPRSSARRRG